MHLFQELKIGDLYIAISESKSADEVISAQAIERIQRCLDNPEVVANIRNQEDRAIRDACGFGSIQAVNLLLVVPEILDNIAYKNNRILNIAAANQHYDIVELLLSIDAVKHEVVRDCSKLMASVSAWNAERVARLETLLKEAGAPIEQIHQCDVQMEA